MRAKVEKVENQNRYSWSSINQHVFHLMFSTSDRKSAPVINIRNIEKINEIGKADLRVMYASTWQLRDAFKMQLVIKDCNAILRL